MKRIVALSLVMVFLNACSGSTKIKSIVDFTEKLTPNSSQKVEVGSSHVVGDFGNELSFIQNSAISIKLKPISGTSYKKISLGGSSIVAMPSIAGGNVYSVDCYGNVQSVDLSTGKRNWQVPLNADKGLITSAVLVYSQEKLYVIADLQLFELNAQTGKEIARKSMSDLVKNQPLIISNAFYVQNVSNNLMAYNSETWVPVWVYETWPETLLSGTITSPVFAGGQIISNYSTGQVVSNNALDGKELWQLNLYKESETSLGYAPQNASCQPIVINNDLFIASNNGYLIKVDITRGAVVWQKRVQDILSMSVSGNTIFVTNNARQLAAISISDGSVIWTADLQDPKRNLTDKVKATSFLTPIVSDQGIIVLAKDGKSFIFDATTGSLVRYFQTPKDVISFGINGEELVAFDKRSGYILN